MSDDVTQASTSNRSTETIGPYRLLQRVGEGGMGEVWLAEQTRPVHRQVALKVIKAGMDTAQVVARFEAERQALALMSHPAIAQVFDAGVTPQGRPFFAMEYVRGEPITAYCDRQRLSMAQRLHLFIEVCDGVQHAHQKGIIHRDLKPSNILVTVLDDRAVPKIIDFGVAKATTQHLTERTLYTELGVLIGTPEYMSPEQAEMTGLDIDTRTDVYALGVILYELLAGVLPFDSKSLREKGLDEIRRTIRDTDPPRPSTRITSLGARATGVAEIRGTNPARLASQLRGDLDWITMKALEKDRTRRYGSVSDLAADLRRHLDDVPVLASPPSTVYRVSKFVRRHRMGVAVAATLVFVLAAFAATMAVQARRIARERDRANTEAESAKQVANFLSGLFNVSDPSEARGNTLTAREILDKGAQNIERSLASQPQVRAKLEATIGNVYTNLGIYKAAAPLLERAVETQQRTLGPDHSETLSSMNALANVYWYQGRYDEAEPLYVAVLDRRRRTLGQEHAETLQAAYDLGSLYTVQRRWTEAEQLTRQTFEIQRRVAGEEHPDTLSTMNNLASLFWRQARYSDAEPLYVKILEIRRRSIGGDHPDTLTSIHNLATTYDALGRYADAERLYLEVCEAKRRVLGEVHPATTLSIARLAGMYVKIKRYDEAESLLLDVARRLQIGPGREGQPTRTEFQAQGAAVNVARQLVDLYDAWGKPGRAAEWRATLPREPAATAVR